MTRFPHRPFCEVESLEYRQLLSGAIRTYLIGNSLTDAVNYAAFDELLGNADSSVAYGRQTGPGFPLAYNYDLSSGYVTGGSDPSRPTVRQPFGNYKTAFANFTWDDLTLQTNERHLTTDVYNGENQAEVPISLKFMEALGVHSPDAQVFIYERPTRRNDVTDSLASTGEVNNYSAEYLQTYVDSNVNNNNYYTRSYFSQLMPLLTAAQKKDSVASKMPAVKLIPAGETYYNLDQAIKAGDFAGTGITDIKDFYADQSHPTGIGAYAIGLTFYSALTGKDPRGVAATADYISQDSRLASAKIQSLIQTAVYKAMNTTAFSGYLTKLGASTGTGTGTGTTTPTGSGTLRVTAYNDVNGDGIFDTGDTPKKGVVIYIDANDDGQLDNGEASATTHTNGRAVFGSVTAGAYTIRGVTGEADISQSIASQSLSITANKTRALGLGIVPSAGVTVVGAGTSTLRGYVRSDDDGVTANVSGRTVFIDLNRDGKLESYEPSTTSNSRGKYLFADVPAGLYPLRQMLPDGWTQLIPTAAYADAFAVAAGKTRVVSFVSAPPSGSISGFVENDLNDNGELDATDVGLKSRTVYLDLNDNGQLDSGEPSTTTNSRGAFTFNNLAAGSYVLREILPTGWTYTGAAASAALQLTLDTDQVVTGQIILNALA